MRRRLIAAFAAVLATGAQLPSGLACSPDATGAGSALPAAVAAATSGAGRCGAGQHWQETHYNHLMQYEPGHCVAG